ncbi:MAG: transposase [Moorea sp. SIO4A3]|nr:transposase [Moorena sp. SIO4A3]
MCGLTKATEEARLQQVASGCELQLEVVKRHQRSFEIQPRRWVVERTFAWDRRQRRLSKDYERLPEVSESVVYIAMIPLMLNRLTA